MISFYMQIIHTSGFVLGIIKTVREKTGSTKPQEKKKQESRE
jgi:hypothetical protein